MSDVSIDRGAVREMVEDFWRSYILFLRGSRERHAGASPEDLAEERRQFSRRAWERFEATAALIPSEQAQALPASRRQGLGEMAVRTAVRATIWELIRSLFRR